MKLSTLIKAAAGATAITTAILTSGCAQSNPATVKHKESGWVDVNGILTWEYWFIISNSMNRVYVPYNTYNVVSPGYTYTGPTSSTGLGTSYSSVGSYSNPDEDENNSDDTGDDDGTDEGQSTHTGIQSNTGSSDDEDEDSGDDESDDDDSGFSDDVDSGDDDGSAPFVIVVR